MKFSKLKLRRKMPADTRSRVSARFQGAISVFSHGTNIIVRKVPNMGVVKLNTVTRDTGLYLSSRPQRD